MRSLLPLEACLQGLNIPSSCAYRKGELSYLDGPMQVAASAVEQTGSKAALKAAFGILMTAEAPKVGIILFLHNLIEQVSL